MAKKSENKKTPTFMPMFPGMMPPWNGKGDKGRDTKATAETKKLSSDMKSFLNNSIEMQKASADSAKEQFNQLFAYTMGLHDGLATILPGKLPTIPGLPIDPVSPKDLVMYAKEIQELANEHFVKQMDSQVDFFIMAQQKTVEMIPELPDEDELEEAAEVAEEEAEVKAAVEEELEEAADEETLEEEAAEEIEEAVDEIVEEAEELEDEDDIEEELEEEAAEDEEEPAEELEEEAAEDEEEPAEELED